MITYKNKSKFYPVGNRRFSFGAFTLIELLVVIAVIVLLSSIVLVSLQMPRKKARDIKRQLDINEIEKALLLYQMKYGQFPSENVYDTSLGSGGTFPTGNDWDYNSYIWRGLVGEGFIGTLPKDPINNATYYYLYEPCCYQTCGGGTTCPSSCCEYKICANRLETTGSSYCKSGRF